jgi:lipopolysaccharide biosynthesis protein
MMLESGLRSAAVRLLAFYLPQFHPIRENDGWWGEGFTEWTNVVRAKPLFRGHVQPHLPSDLGFYDLRVPEVREAQAAMAHRYGISGFCYYHYWFSGRRLLNRPFDEVLSSGRPDFPFCLCWANENWTRAWDGKDQEVLIGQRHSVEDDHAHIRHLLPAFADPRYIRVDGKPLFLVYRTELLPDPARTADIWRKEASAAGIGDLYLARVESSARGFDPKTIGFDAAVEFAPDWGVLPTPMFRRRRWRVLARLQHHLGGTGLTPNVYFRHRVYRYDELVRHMLAKPEVHYKRFRCVTPRWDNSPRRPIDSVIFRDSTPAAYERWLREVMQATLGTFQGDERMVFVNAWNEWAEGNHLEPDQHLGRAYLEATARAAGIVLPRHGPDQA